MKDEAPKELTLKAAPLRLVHVTWSWRGVLFFFAANTEMENVVLVRFVQINWLKKPHWEWDESFTFVEEKGPKKEG